MHKYNVTDDGMTHSTRRVDAKDCAVQGGIEALYAKLDAEKGDLVERAEEYAQWTLPNVFPIYDTMYEQRGDWQSVGAQAVNHLSNKFMIALFSPSKPFFRMELTPELSKTMIAQGMDKAAQDEAMARAEQRAFMQMGTMGIRQQLVMALQLLIITGNCLFYVDTTKQQSMAYSLRDYVVKRDLSGKVVCVITRDRKNKHAIPAEYKQYVPDNITDMSDSTIALYTKIDFIGEEAHVTQYLGNSHIPELAVNYKRKECPWIPLTWKLPRGYSYGTGLVEEYAGDFTALSHICQAMAQGAAAACDFKYLVDPTGTTDVDELNGSPSGTYVNGREGDISAYTLGNKATDLQFALEAMRWYEKRIGTAFMLNSAVTRDAERVTAEEISLQAQELETAQGGVYSRLAEDLQTPLAYILMSTVDLGVDADDLEPRIITGIDSLSRAGDLQSIMTFLGHLSVIDELPQSVRMRLDEANLIAEIGAGDGVDYTEFMLDDDAVEEKRKKEIEYALAIQSAKMGETIPGQ